MVAKHGHFQGRHVVQGRKEEARGTSIWMGFDIELVDADSLEFGILDSFVNDGEALIFLSTARDIAVGIGVGISVGLALDLDDATAL